MNSTIHKSSAIQHFEHDNAINIHNRIILKLDFYMGLSYM